MRKAKGVASQTTTEQSTELFPITRMWQRPYKDSVVAERENAKLETRNKRPFKKQKVDATRPVVLKHQHRHCFEQRATRCKIFTETTALFEFENGESLPRNFAAASRRQLSVENFYNNARRIATRINGFIDRQQSNFSEQLLLSSITQCVMGLHIHKCSQRV